MNNLPRRALNIREDKEINLHKTFGTKIETAESFLLLDQCDCWDRELISSNHLFSRCLEQMKKATIDTQSVINRRNELSVECWYTIEEGSRSFITAISENNWNSALELEDEIIELIERCHNSHEL